MNNLQKHQAENKLNSDLNPHLGFSDKKKSKSQSKIQKPSYDRQSLGNLISTIKLDEKEFNILSFQNEADKQLSFLRKLTYMTERVKVYTDYFSQKLPNYERHYIERKQKEIE